MSFCAPLRRRVLLVLLQRRYVGIYFRRDLRRVCARDRIRLDFFRLSSDTGGKSQRLLQDTVIRCNLDLTFSFLPSSSV
jgi:hypothetical protein